MSPLRQPSKLPPHRSPGIRSVDCPPISRRGATDSPATACPSSIAPKAATQHAPSALTKKPSSLDRAQPAEHASEEAIPLSRYSTGPLRRQKIGGQPTQHPHQTTIERRPAQSSALHIIPGHETGLLWWYLCRLGAQALSRRLRGISPRLYLAEQNALVIAGQRGPPPGLPGATATGSNG